MSKPIIEVKNLSKKYRIGLRQPYYSLRDTLMGFAKDPFASLKKRGVSNEDLAEDEFWVLKDVSFKVMPGETFGIIGRNGAGKTTLLKLLSQITPPTKGEIILRGRVASLLEVGTGFHPELTGRENIYLNGAILGMKQKEIKKKFDEIVEFAEVEKFLDTPVKHYSSGIYMRLAFAVAAHLEPEILLVDEVLAVGDISFQKKCLGKMEDIGRKGRTILFVSHNIQMITRLCQRVILLDKGKLTSDGPVNQVVNKYLYPDRSMQISREWPQMSTAPGDEVVRLRLVRLRNRSGKTQQIFDSSEEFGIEIGYTILKSIKRLIAEIALYNQEGQLIFASANQYDEKLFSLHKAGNYLAACWISGNLLTEGSFFVRVNILQLETPLVKHIKEPDILVFQIVDRLRGNSARGHITHSYPGIIRPKLKWNTDYGVNF